MSVTALGAYLELLDDFLAGTVTAGEFQTRYFRRFKQETATWPEPVFRVLDGLFADVDAYVEDAALRDPGDLDDEQLHARAREAREALRRHAGGSGRRA